MTKDTFIYDSTHAQISNIQRYTIHDGPGIRTAVFFTGCTLRCIWCSNPETIEPRARLGVFPQKCLTGQKCGACINRCPMTVPAIKFDDNGFLKAVNQTEECAKCTYKCAEVCPPRAIKLWNSTMTRPELMTIIEKDRDFYKTGGGGVTLTGGEPLLQWEFAKELLRECKAEGISTCVETALNCPVEHMEAVFEYTDLVITDIKHMDSVRHKSFTGAGNEQILKNIKRTAQLNKPMVIRTPIVPGYNGDEENLLKTGEFISELGGKILQYQLLPYRRLGLEKYESLGISYPMADYTPSAREDSDKMILDFANTLSRKFKIPAVAGSSFALDGNMVQF